MYGSELDGASFRDPATVKKYARRAQLSEIFDRRHTVYRNKPGISKLQLLQLQ